MNRFLKDCKFIKEKKWVEVTGGLKVFNLPPWLAELADSEWLPKVNTWDESKTSP